MGSTLAQLRDLVRKEVGDEERVTGTATGGSLTTVVDSSRLTQADDYWQALKVFIKDTTDDFAPKGETKRIATSSSSSTNITTELPFSAAVQSGDTYGIAVFSDSQIDQAINDALLQEISKYLPEFTTETLSVTANEYKFTPTSSARIRWIDRIEFVDSANQDITDYRGKWTWNKFRKMVEFNFWWSEAKSLTIHIARDHSKLSADSDTVSLLVRDEPYLVKIAAAELIMKIPKNSFKGDFGNLNPSSWQTGDVQESYDNVIKFFDGEKKRAVEQLEKLAVRHLSVG